MGAALLAMVACGAYSSLQECISTQMKEEILPDRQLAERYEERYQKFRKIYPAVRELYQLLKGES